MKVTRTSKAPVEAVLLWRVGWVAPHRGGRVIADYASAKSAIPASQHTPAKGLAAVEVPIDEPGCGVARGAVFGGQLLRTGIR